jgi:glycosyltransferase involved in cell wall biosynthesis
MKINKSPLIISPSYTNYEDRAYMFSMLIKKVNNGSIHFHNMADSVSKQIKHTSPKSSVPIIKWITTFKITRKWIKEHGDNVVVHDLFAPRGAFASIFNKKSIKVLSLYADNANYYLGKRYKEETKNNSFKNRLYIHYMYLKRILIEYVGIMLADGVIANSPEIIDGIEKYYKPKNKKLKVINTSVNTDFWKIIDIPRESKTIFFAGRLSKRKGLDILLKSFCNLLKNDKSLKLVIAGEESMEESFEWGYEFIEKNNIKNNIVILGQISREEIREWYNKATVFVLPSNQEGSPRVIKEAMACGCPIVCTEIAGTKILDPENRILNYFLMKNEKDLSLKIETVINNNQDYKAISNYAIENFSPDIISDNIIRFYSEL